MSYRSYKNEVLQALSKSKKEILDTIGNYVVAEAQMRTTVKTGNLRRSETFDILDNDEGVAVGVTPDAEYGIYVEKGSSKQKAQPFLEPAIMDNLSNIEKIAGEKISANMGGD